MKHRPARCSCCGKSLKKAPVTAVERRQVIDIPPVKAVTTEHQMLTVKCGCGCETKAQAPDGVTRAGPVRAPDHGHRHLPLARPVPVPRPRLPGAFRPVRLRSLARRPRRGRAEDRGLPRPGGAGHHAAPDQRGSRPLRRDRVPHRREARLGPLRLGGEVRAVHRARQARQGRDEGRRGPAALRAESPSTTPGHPTTPSATSQATHCAVRTYCASWSRSPRPARTSTGPGHSRPSTRCSP